MHNMYILHSYRTTQVLYPLNMLQTQVDRKCEQRPQSKPGTKCVLGVGNCCESLSLLHTNGTRVSGL